MGAIQSYTANKAHSNDLVTSEAVTAQRNNANTSALRIEGVTLVSSLRAPAEGDTDVASADYHTVAQTGGTKARLLNAARHGEGSITVNSNEDVIKGFNWYDQGDNAAQYRQVNANMTQSVFIKIDENGQVLPTEQQYPEDAPLTDDDFENAAVQKHLNDGKNTDDLLIVDLGCGSGRALQRLKAEFPGINVKGLDGSVKQLEQAKVTGLTDTELAQADLSEDQLPLGTSSVDTISCNSVIQYFDPETLNHVLSEMARVIKPGTGVASIMFKTTDNDSPRPDNSPEKRQVIDKAYEQTREFLLWPTTAVKAMASQHGLEVASFGKNDQGDDLANVSLIRESRGISYANIAFYKPAIA